MNVCTLKLHLPSPPFSLWFTLLWNLLSFTLHFSFLLVVVLYNTITITNLQRTQLLVNMNWLSRRTRHRNCRLMSFAVSVTRFCVQLAFDSCKCCCFSSNFVQALSASWLCMLPIHCLGFIHRFLSLFVPAHACIFSQMTVLFFLCKLCPPLEWKKKLAAPCLQTVCLQTAIIDALHSSLIASLAC